MKKNTLKLAVAASAMTMIFAGCGDDVLVSEEVAQSFTTVKSINPKDCNDKTEGSMAFVKDESTMYVCTDGEWIALNDQDAIEYRCETKSFSEGEKSGVKIICDGDTIGTVYNGEKGAKGKQGDPGENGKNGENGDNADMKAVEKAIKDGLKDASEELGKEVDKKLSSASANHDEDIKNLDDKLSSASAKSELDNDELDKKLSDLAEEYDKSCKLNAEPEYSKDGKTVTISVKCGKVEKKFVANLDDENLKKVYKKHVVVRFPVYAEKTTSSEDVYEEIWANLKGGNHTELTVVDLDEKLKVTGKMFVTDLFADATKSGAFVTVEGTNKKEVNYKVARLEGDLDITNLSSPVVQLRLTLNLGTFWMNEELVLTSFVDLTDADPKKAESSDTLVIDFLTDYKAARVKNLVKGGKTFAEADAQANTEVANAFALNGDGEYPTLEHYLPNKADFNEYFNSVVWVVALLDQLDIVQNFNGVYNDFRKSLAENGNLRELVKTSFRGEEREMYFGDYLFLLIYTNFYKYRNDNQDPVYYRGGCTDDDPVCNSVNYKIVQKYFKDIYGLDDASGKDLGDGRKIVKSQTTDGYFNYFVYDKAEKIWYPLEASSDNLKLLVQKVLNLDECVASIYGTVEHVNISGIDYTLECFKNMSSSSAWFSNLEESDVSICKKRKDGASVTYFDFGGDVKTGVCKDGALVNANGETAANGKTIDEILNPAEGEGPLGKCTAANKDVVKSFDEKDAERSTTTGYGDYICNGAKWVKARPVDLYCVGDHVKATEQKVADEDLAALGLKYDQKCEFEDVLYVKNSEEAGSEWIDATGYIRRTGRRFAPRAINGARIIDIPVGYGTLVTKLGIRDSVYVFMNGYKENAIYKCIDDECSELSDDNAITKFVNQFRDENGKNSFTSTDSLSIFCNKAEYKKAASGYVERIAYEVELGNAASKTKYVASANRKDWHEVGPSDLYGECSESVMKNAEANWVTVGGQKYACDCDQDGDKLECDWRKGTATETAVDKPCTKNIADAETVTLFNGPNSKVYLCKNTPDGDNSRDLVEATREAWCAENRKLLADHDEECQAGEEVCTICDNIPEGIEGSGKTYIKRSTSGNVETVTAESFFNVDCAEVPHFIGDLASYQFGYYNEYSEDQYKYTDNSLVHDFICNEKGNVAEAADEQEACNAAFEKTDICKYMKEYYRYEGTATEGEWKKITTAEEYCNLMVKKEKGWNDCSYESIAAAEGPEGGCAEDDASCQQWEMLVFDYTCFVPSGLTWPESVDSSEESLVGQCGLSPEGWRWSSGV